MFVTDYSQWIDKLDYFIKLQSEAQFFSFHAPVVIVLKYVSLLKSTAYVHI